MYVIIFFRLECAVLMDLMALYNTLFPMTENLNASFVTAVVITGLCVVFLGLVILILFVWAFGKIFSKKQKKPEAAPDLSLIHI